MPPPSADRHLFGDIEGNHLAAAWLGASTDDFPTYGVDTTPVRLAVGASEDRGVVITLIPVLALIEARTGRHTWRQNGENNTAGRYLRALKDWGYTLPDVESSPSPAVPPEPRRSPQRMVRPPGRAIPS